jgi:uncharacterized membrane protein YfcA
MKYWFLYVGVFYLVYIFLTLFRGLWTAAVEHWPIAIAMSLGSVVAGSTPMGGGTVGFPVLVLLLHQSASIGRNFGMAAQALGMTSAMIFILCRRTPVQKLMLVWGILGAVAGLLSGTFIISPLLPGNIVKLLFSSVWMSFGILTLARNREICSLDRVPKLGRRADVATALCVGLLGAVTSVMGIGLHALLGDIGQETFFNWLAAAPIIVFGAPLGAYLVSIIPRIRTLYFVSILCLVQFVWTLYQVSPKLGEWIFVTTTLVAAGLCFYFLYRRGRVDELRARPV